MTFDVMVREIRRGAVPTNSVLTVDGEYELDRWLSGLPSDEFASDAPFMEEYALDAWLAYSRLPGPRIALVLRKTFGTGAECEVEMRRSVLQDARDPYHAPAIKALTALLAYLVKTR